MLYNNQLYNIVGYLYSFCALSVQLLVQLDNNNKVFSTFFDSIKHKTCGMMKYLLTEFSPTCRENICLILEPDIFPSGPPTQSTSA